MCSTNILDVSICTVHSIIHDQLHMANVSLRWVPRLPTTNQRHERVQSCQERLTRYSAEENDF